LNHSLSDRALLLLLASVTALGPIATNLYLPALPAVREYFGASVAEVQATFSVSLVLFAFGILAWGPVSDRFGRRTAILGGLAIMVSGAIACLVAPTLHWLIAGRALQAFGVATGLVTARARSRV
jgi:DHA1 family bicyclomycin/chloramphenicol resistance-like MFS transporter